MPHETDRNLLLGFLALQNDFVSREALVAAVSRWLTDKTRRLDDVLLEQKAIDEEMRQLLTALVEKHLDRHDGDTQRSLCSVSSAETVYDDLRLLGDDELEASLDCLSTSERVASADSVTLTATGDDALRFRVLRPHARGGLGQISVAEDTELHREVALKEIRSPHADDPNSRARFVLEAEITGRLEHPGIVPVYGLGNYSDGRPFYAMRFIRGDSLKKAVDRFYQESRDNEDAPQVEVARAAYDSIAFRKLLGRFVDVCNAIEYAHSRGVLHRDLKPGNIMLGKYGETLVVDWGLAKVRSRDAAYQTADEQTLRPNSGSGSDPTQMGAVIGTPAYMSPEQAGGQVDQLGPLSDVYSLGATLYYVLTGMPPVTRNQNNVLQRVERGEFPPPRLRRPQVPRPLESICLKAMALNPDDRYRSASVLADEIERWLADQPVAAFPDPPAVRFGRWARRHRTLIASASVGGLVLLMSLLAVLVLVTDHNRTLNTKNVKLDGLNQDLEQANTDLKEANRQERLAKEKAAKNGKQLEDTLEYMDGLFTIAEPGDPTSTATRFADAVKDAEESFVEPLARARVLNSLGLTLHSLGRYAEAIEAHRRAAELRRESSVNPDDYYTSLNNLATVYLDDDRPGDAVALLEDVVDWRRDNLGDNDSATLTSINNLAVALDNDGQREESLPLYEEAYRRRLEILGQEDWATLTSMGNLARVYQDLGQMDDAVNLMEKTLKAKQKTLGAKDPSTLTTMGNLAAAYRRANRPQDALELYIETVDLCREVLTEQHPDTQFWMSNLAVVHMEAEQMDKAYELLRQVLKAQTETIGRRHKDRLKTLFNLGAVYYANERPKEAEPLLRECYEIWSEDRPDDWYRFEILSLLGRTIRDQKRFAEAEPLLIQGHEGIRDRLQKMPPFERDRLILGLDALVKLYEQWDKPDEVTKWKEVREQMKSRLEEP